MPDDNKLFTPRNFYLFLLILGGLLLSTMTGWGVMETSEARYAEISREMLETGDYLHPRLLSIGHFHKPPLTYWITATGMYLFGTNPAGVRFFLQLSLLLQIWAVYKIGLHLFENQKTAIISAVVYFSLPVVIVATRGLTTDSYLTTAVLFSIYGWLKYRKSHQLNGLYLFYISLGLGFFIKGPVVFIVPLPVVLAINYLYAPSKAHWANHLAGIGLFLLIGGSWFFYLFRENASFIPYFLKEHTLDRLTTNRFGRNQPFWFYAVIVPVTSIPWFFLIISRISQRVKERAIKKFSILHLLVLWVFFPILFFSFSHSKLVLYILPVMSGVALGGAYAWQEVRAFKNWNLFTLLYSILILFGMVLLPVLSEEIQLGLTSQTLLISGLFLLAIYFSVTSYYRPSLTMPGLGLITIVSLILIVPDFMKHNAVMIHDQKAVADRIIELEAEKVYVYNHQTPSIAFHLDQLIVSVDDGHHTLNREIQFMNAPYWEKTLLPLESIPYDFKKQAVLVIREKDWEAVESLSRNGQFNHKELIEGWWLLY